MGLFLNSILFLKSQKFILLKIVKNSNFIQNQFS